MVAKKKIRLQSILEKMCLYRLNNSDKRKIYHLQMFFVPLRKEECSLQC